jgi:GT2 family glycosyltransferase
VDGAPSISVVIPTRRRPDLLPRSVEAVLAQATSLPFEVLVVNDDHEPLRCRLPDDPRLRLFTSGGQGVCAARNLGITEAWAPIVAFTDDDTVAPPGWIDALTGALGARPDALGVEGPLDYGREVDPLYEHVPRPELPGGYCSCNVAYRREALLAVGSFDEHFVRPGAEDVDLGLRVATRGPVVFEPTMVMCHPPRAAKAREIMRRGKQVENDWLLHVKHPDLSGKVRPSRWGGVVWRAREYGEYVLDPAVTLGSPARVARAALLGVGTTAVALAVACTRRMPGPT